MSLFRMAWRNLMNRGIQTAITVVVVCIGLSMTLSISAISGGIKEGIVRASEPFGMIVGSKGSASQLVFNTVFLMDNPLSNIPLSYYEKLEHDERVAQAVPFALGDNYAGFRLVGTTPEFFTLKGKPSDPPYFTLASGRLFGKAFEAVIGSDAAKRTGLRLGDTFVSGHGTTRSLQGGEEDEHGDHPYTVVGILHPVSAPSDQGVYVSMDSYWVSHEHGDHSEAAAGEHKAAAAAPSGNGTAGTEMDDDDEHGVTAALVKPRSYSDLMRMYQEINRSSEAQAVFPGQVIAKLFDMMGSGEQILTSISFVVLGMAALTVALALYGSTMERRRTVSILRAIGAGRGSIFAIVLLESLLVVLLGCFGGVLLSGLLSWALVQYIGTQMSIAVPLGFTWHQLGIVGMVALFGLAAGIVPAVSAYRTEVVRYLHAS